MQLEIRKKISDRNAPNIVLVHGTGHGAWCWDEGFAHFFCKRGFNVYAVSLRGHGKSSGADMLDQFSLRDYAHDIKQITDTFCTAPIIIAHSMGASVVYAYLKYVSSAVEKIVFLAPTPVHTMFRNTMHWISRNSRLSPDDLYWNRRIPSDQAAVYRTLVSARESAKVKMQLLFGLVKPPRIRTIPMLTVASRSDRVMLLDDVRRQADYFGAHLLLVDSMCHDMMLDSGWKQLAEHILLFLSSPSD